GMCRATRERSGSVMVLSYLLVSFFLALGSATMVTSVNEQRLVLRSRDLTHAFQVAEAGLEDAMVQLRTGNAASIGATNFAQGSYTVSITHPSLLASNQYLVQASGQVNGLTRTLELIGEVTPKSVFWYPLLGDNSVNLKKYAMTNSYNSSQGDYDPATAGQDGNVSTNSTTAHSIQLRQGTVVNGQVIVGTGMSNPNDAVDLDDSTIITGVPPITSASQAVTLPAVNTAGLDCSHDLNLPKNSTYTFSESSSPYCFDDLKADQGSKIAVSGNVVVYANRVDFDKNLEVNVGGKPPQLLLQVYGASDVVIDKEGTFVGALYAPAARVRLKKEVDCYGSLVGKDIEIDKESMFHYDEALKNVSTPTGGYDVTVKSWREQ
ncbi:MAG: hypothetical protein HYZ88_02990, partial [Candidatus Omnitrophica bacterium]|nr:hypothetical protein [Candidatus Omnitrophota bacterium]